MKKNLLYLFTVLCTMSFFTACGDDDDDPVVDDSWKALSSTYQSDKLVLTLNDVSALGTVTVSATSAEAATVTLNNAVPDDKAVAIDATLAKSGSDYNVTGETTVNGATLKITGTFKSGVLTMNIARTVSSALSGTWKLKTPMTTAVMVNIVTGDPATDGQMAQMGPMLGVQLAAKVTGVTVGISENGSVNPISWNKIDGTTGSMPDMISLKYIVKDNQLLLAIDKALVDMALPMLPALGITIDAATLKAMLIDMGGYYGFPVNYKQDGNDTTFYLNKAQLTGLVALLPALAPLLPEGSPITAIVTTMGTVLAVAQTAEIGLTFTK